MSRKHPKSSNVGALCALSLAIALQGTAGLPRERVVLITIDTLRYDAFADGAGGSSMPATRAFAERGQIFERFYSASSATQPTHASLFTGLHPWQHGVPDNGKVLSESHGTIAEKMQAAGFRTGAVVASFPLKARFGFAQGFDRYDDAVSVESGVEDWMGERVSGGRFYSRGDEVTARALELLDSLGGERQFVWIHYFDPHAPYGDGSGREISPQEIRRAANAGSPVLAPMVTQARRGYARDVVFLDVVMAPLLQRLAGDSASIETHVVFTADHGESLGEEGVIGHGDHTTLEQVHVPTFIVSPGLEPGTRDDVAGSVDLAGTLLSLAGIAEALPGGGDLTRPALESPHSALGMRRPRTRTGRYAGTDGRVTKLPRLEFFVVRGDDFYRGDGDRVERNGQIEGAADVQSLFTRFGEELAGQDTVQLDDPETREALKALGYAE